MTLSPVTFIKKVIVLKSFMSDAQLTQISTAKTETLLVTNTGDPKVINKSENSIVIKILTVGTKLFSKKCTNTQEKEALFLITKYLLLE